jgi:hypothetical protein
MIYVHVAEAHRRDIPERVLVAAVGEMDPDRRIFLMLDRPPADQSRTIQAT